ncbi:hypothetical protein ABT154_19200 [Streptomyces sp. NPDC001728]|uniref:hypothetical protein n=1 Tax=Streptomyces sp. NPDC001728 TaxID=3154396 RepID=UPI00332A9901
MKDLVREGAFPRVSGFLPSHRQLLLISEATLVDGTTPRVEVCFGLVKLMFLKPLYRNGLHIRWASTAEFGVLSARHGDPAEDAAYTWVLDPDGEGFVVCAHPSWREAEYALMGERQPLYDPRGPWPPEFPAESGHVS